MRFAVLPYTEPAWNLAAEEHLLLSSHEDVCLLWRGAPSVIIGRNQNAYAELDVGYAEREKITVCRRLTGGGAVFHDLGNVNFTFLTDAVPGASLDFGRFLDPVVRALRDMGVPAEKSGRNDILAHGRKISGNAQCVMRAPDGTERLLHHGTLLFSADISRMTGVLRADPAKLASKGVGSVQSRVCNIAAIETYRGPRDVLGFMDVLGCALGENADCRPLSDGEMRDIAALRDAKYATWAWNFGESKTFEVSRKKRFSFGSVTLAFSAEHGVLTAVSVTGDFFGTRPVETLEAALLGCRLEKTALDTVLTDELVGGAVAGMTAEDFAALFFPAAETDKEAT